MATWDWRLCRNLTPGVKSVNKEDIVLLFLGHVVVITEGVKEGSNNHIFIES